MCGRKQIVSCKFLLVPPSLPLNRKPSLTFSLIYLVDGKLVRVPSGNTLGVHIHNGYLHVLPPLQGNNRAGGSTDIALVFKIGKGEKREKEIKK